ncbi:hypothetical protein P4H61_14275 [Paenibacillus peoriae]|uniref:glycosyl transferase n=1 Tax=Paenibacillus peoriae TaxID=59893 RepID=UPI00026C6646|nr:glycosyl transferase [Paenibacillus peoriae]MEC0182646.1 hypothetical protein [Paenibacillus peoriae]
MESLPRVSVIIPFFNCPYVDQAVCSVLNQTYPTDFYYLNEPLTAYRHHEQMDTVQYYQAIEQELETVRQTYQTPLQMVVNTL